MLSDLLGLNWQLFESLNAGAGKDPPLDSVMVFGAQDLIFLVPLLFLALWIGILRWPAHRKAAVSGSTVATATDRARMLGQQMVLLTVVAVVGALALNLVLAHLIHEPRPFISHPSQVHDLVPHAADNAFPSDHETVASALAAMLLLYAGQLLAPVKGLMGGIGAAPRWLLILAVPLALLGLGMALLIGLARIYVGVHYPFDILGGMLCGAFGGGVAVAARRVVQPILDAVLGVAERLRLA